jgi:hypothetical protein
MPPKRAAFVCSSTLESPSTSESSSSSSSETSWTAAAVALARAAALERLRASSATATLKMPAALSDSVAAGLPASQTAPPSSALTPRPRRTCCSSAAPTPRPRSTRCAPLSPLADAAASTSNCRELQRSRKEALRARDLATRASPPPTPSDASATLVDGAKAGARLTARGRVGHAGRSVRAGACAAGEAMSSAGTPAAGGCC